MKGISFHFNPVMTLKIPAFSCSVCCICTLLLWLFFFQLSSYVDDISSLNNFTVTFYGRNFYYQPVNKTTEVKSIDISNAAAFCSEIRKQIKKPRLQSWSNQAVKQNTTKIFDINLKVSWALTALASAHLVTTTVHEGVVPICQYPVKKPPQAFLCFHLLIPTVKPGANKLQKHFWKFFWFCFVLIVWAWKSWPLIGQVKCQ